MKKEQKDSLKKMSAKELMEKLQEFETEKQRMEIYLRMNGHSAKRYAYNNKFDLASGNISKEYRSGNLREIRKNIARIKTFLNIKLKANAT